MLAVVRPTDTFLLYVLMSRGRLPRVNIYVSLHEVHDDEFYV